MEGGDGEGGGRGPQSVQSWPSTQLVYSAPGPPSSQSPSLLYAHALVPPPGQLGGGGDDGGDGGDRGGGKGGGGVLGGGGDDGGDGGDSDGGGGDDEVDLKGGTQGRYAFQHGTSAVIPVPEYDGGGTRTPQSVQSDPRGHLLELVSCDSDSSSWSYSEPGPPSSQIPSLVQSSSSFLQESVHSVA